MIWTKQENEERELNNMLNHKGETCKTCQWCNYEEGELFFTCGYHIQNFTPTSWCSYHTDPKDPKLLAYNERRKSTITKRFNQLRKN